MGGVPDTPGLPWGFWGSGVVPGLIIPEPPDADELSEEASEDEVFIFCDKELLLLWLLLLLLLDIFAICVSKIIPIGLAHCSSNISVVF